MPSIQHIIVYLLIAFALVGLGRFVYRKWKTLKKESTCSSCDHCPLKADCGRKSIPKKKN